MESKNFEIKSNVSTLFNSMIEVINILEANKIISFLNYGALLGYVRERRLLPWNNDVELCAYYTSEFKENIILVMECLIEKGYSVYYHEYCGTLNLKKKDAEINLNLIWKKDDVFIRPHDTGAKKSTSNIVSFYLYWIACYMFVFKLKSNTRSSSLSGYLKHVYTSFFQLIPTKYKLFIYNILLDLSKLFGAKFLSTSYPINLLSELKTVDFKGHNVRIPVNANELLSYLYGNNWHIPKENWAFYDLKNKNETKIQFIKDRISIADWKFLN